METATLVELFILFITMVVQVIVPPIPAELIVIAAGRQYGPLLTTVFAGSGLLVGSIIVFFLGTLIHSKLAFFKQPKAEKVMARIRQHENLILWVRVLPYNPADIISYAAGIMRVLPKKFVFISFCASYLRTLILALLGARIEDLKGLFITLSVLFISWLAGTIIVYGRRNNS